jgi:hypothetical protein
VNSRWLRALDFVSAIGRAEIDFRPFVRRVRDHPEWVVLGMGVVLRLAAYVSNRQYWPDESALASNVAGFGPLDFSHELKGDQLAPFGFLIVQRALAWAIGSSRYAMRLLPLACGLAALCLFTVLARRLCARPAVLIALVLFALSDDLIYYSSEMKPYTLDLAVGLLLNLGALDALERPITPRRAAALGLLAVTAPWFSFPSAFVMGGAGTALILASLRGRRYRDAAIALGIGGAWLVSFFVAYRCSLALLSPYTTMYYFWDFAFLPTWPLSRANLARCGGILLEIFVNPLNLVVPSWRVSVVLPVLLFLLGIACLARRSGSRCLLLALPIVLAMIASALKRYPLHGRLTLELVPAFFLLIAEGAMALGALDRAPRKRAYKLIMFLFLLYPCASSIYEATGKRPRYFNRHGDLHSNQFMT